MISFTDKIQSLIKKRGVRTLTGLSAHFCRCDRTGDGLLDRFELEQALKDYHINLSKEVEVQFLFTSARLHVCYDIRLSSNDVIKASQ